jgi:hypothetical protein
MKEILVREWMTANPQYTYENTRITQAHETMKEKSGYQAFARFAE